MKRHARWLSRLLPAGLLALPCAAVACGENHKGISRSVPVSSTTTPTASRDSSKLPAPALGELIRVAGGGKELGDGGPATAAGFCEATDVARDRGGDLYVADAGRCCEGPGGNSVRRIDGTGAKGSSPERGPATRLNLHDPNGLALGESGVLYIADLFNARIRAVRYSALRPRPPRRLGHRC